MENGSLSAIGSGLYQVSTISILFFLITTQE